MDMMELLNDSLNQRHRAYADITEGTMPSPSFTPGRQRKLGQFTRSGFLGYRMSGCFLFHARSNQWGPRKPLADQMQRMQLFMDAWDQALQDRVVEQAPYDSAS
ncbi:hypothetical protein C2845_PM18G05140 [Panicum miliaceum]|uniref:Uncharacterized protein n=1 Tax=Panicum miliaceum TaxID=4540 RepID=A0A3L6PJW1_PANMI|nr:hypothetical protein C2845_PM18G05140 [Panicum miliaceum]